MPKIAIIYASRTGKTRKMAEAIASGAKSVEGSEVVLKDATKAAPTDVSDAGAVILGGATYNSELIKTMNPFLDALEGVDLKGKVGAAFGSYGWSGEGVPTLIDRMKSFGMAVIEPGTTAVQAPGKDVLEKCIQLGKTIAADLAKQLLFGPSLLIVGNCRSISVSPLCASSVSVVAVSAVITSC